MAQKKSGGTGGDAYKTLADSIKAGQIGCFYILYGDERYLLERSLGELRRRLCPDGLDGFNYKRFEGKDITAAALNDAVSTLPAFAERTMVELRDFDIFNNSEKAKFAELFSDLPEYVCVACVYDTVEFKPDGRLKADKEILKSAQAVEFTTQNRGMLVKWINRHFKDAGKSISEADAEYLILITGGYMGALHSEIEKIAAYASDVQVARSDIDAVVVPVLDAVVYKLTDSIVRGEYDGAMRILDDLFRMREPPQKIIFNISLKMRQLLAARICFENSLRESSLSEICGLRHEFQAKLLMDTARKATLKGCRAAVLLCSDAAYALNSSPDPEARLVELITKLAFVGLCGGVPR